MYQFSYVCARGRSMAVRSLSSRLPAQKYVKVARMDNPREL